MSVRFCVLWIPAWFLEVKNDNTAVWLVCDRSGLAIDHFDLFANLLLFVGS